MRIWTGFSWHMMRPMADTCEHGNELSDSLKGGEFLGQIKDCDTVITEATETKYKFC
jgi:hypothetical protein